MVEQMRKTRDRLESELSKFDSIVASMTEVDVSLHQRVVDAASARDAAFRESQAARQRREVLEKLMQEGTIDLDLIETNEVAADAFRRFCGNPACQFFAGTSQPNSYGRRVLYLRDQFKDITAAMDSADGVLAISADRLSNAEAQLTRARAEYEAATKAKASDRVVAAVKAVTRELAKLTRNIAVSEQVESERANRDRLTEQRAALHEDLSKHDNADVRSRRSVSGAARKLTEATNRWLTILNANEGGAIKIDEKLRVILTLTGKPLSDMKGPSGSSRQRLILAYHAALLEVAFELKGSHPPLLLFDAPKGQELDPDDFAAYLTELRKAFAGKHVQVVMSSRTEMATEEGDRVWEPMFPGEKHPWYLGRDEKPAGDQPAGDQPAGDQPAGDQPAPSPGDPVGAPDADLVAAPVDLASDDGELDGDVAKDETET